MGRIDAPPVTTAPHVDPLLLLPPASRHAVEVRAAGFCASCRPALFPDRRVAPLHISGRFRGDTYLFRLRPVGLPDGREVTRIGDLIAFPQGHVALIRCETDGAGRARPCPCGAHAPAQELLVAGHARIIFE